MARTKVKMHSAGVLDVFNQWAAKDGEARMERVADTARANAPVVTGTYRDSIHVETVRHNGRTVVQVVADAPHAMTVEASQGVLARALDAAGGA